MKPYVNEFFLKTIIFFLKHNFKASYTQRRFKVYFPLDINLHAKERQKPLQLFISAYF